MSRIFRLLFSCVFVCGALLLAQENDRPSYVAAGLINAASGEARLSAGTIAVLQGERLSFESDEVGSEGVRRGYLPLRLAGVQVSIGNLPAPLFSVSPEAIRFQIPHELTSGEHTIQVVRQGYAGPEVTVLLLDDAPALFQADPQTPEALHEDDTPVSIESPARPGGIVNLLATGLGQARTRLESGRVATRRSSLRRRSDLLVTLNGAPLPADAILYAGVCPGFVGLYQIQLRLPSDGEEDPEIRIGFGEPQSPEGLRLPLRRE